MRLPYTTAMIPVGKPTGAAPAPRWRSAWRWLPPGRSSGKPVPRLGETDQVSQADNRFANSKTVCRPMEPWVTSAIWIRGRRRDGRFIPGGVQLGAIVLAPGTGREWVVGVFRESAGAGDGTDRTQRASNGARYDAGIILLRRKNQVILLLAVVWPLLIVPPGARLGRDLGLVLQVCLGAGFGDRRHLLLLFLDLETGLPSLLFELLLLAGLAAAGWKVGWRLRAVRGPAASSVEGWLVRLSAWCSWAVVYGFFSLTSRNPHEGWDGWAIWKSSCAVSGHSLLAGSLLAGNPLDASRLPATAAGVRRPRVEQLGRTGPHHAATADSSPPLAPSGCWVAR